MAVMTVIGAGADGPRYAVARHRSCGWAFDLRCRLGLDHDRLRDLGFRSGSAVAD